MRKILVLLSFALAILLGAGAAQAQVTATVSLSKQVMVVKVDGEVVHVWKVSTGRKGFRTPRGVYKPGRMHAKYFSRKYGGAMPYAVFFKGGYAVHGTTEVAKLGRPASHGCVRLHTANAKKLYALIKQKGRKGAKIVITA
jgi:lipoprotein-anchoring transpeptidase ErfK/SrfK